VGWLLYFRPVSLKHFPYEEARTRPGSRNRLDRLTESTNRSFSYQSQPLSGCSSSVPRDSRCDRPSTLCRGFGPSRSGWWGDFDGDGRDDLVIVYGNDGKARAWVHCSTGAGFEPQISLQTLARFWPKQKWMVKTSVAMAKLIYHPAW
jgi:hypothetical protein